ncbi:MAG: hypothetical protein JO322_00170 [Candidatus Eremiobacteraeota bacterium]|nr:hypothetical protein [Candidatus Eremiobacteraeota bacterium]
MNNDGRIHVLRILDHHGDTQLEFDPEETKTVRDVDMRFRDLMQRGFVAFDVSTQPGKVIRTFDPNATEIIVTPRFAGG